MGQKSLVISRVKEFHLEGWTKTLVPKGWTKTLLPIYFRLFVVAPCHSIYNDPMGPTLYTFPDFVGVKIYLPRDPGSPKLRLVSWNLNTLLKWLYTPIIIWQGEPGSLRSLVYLLYKENKNKQRKEPSPRSQRNWWWWWWHHLTEDSMDQFVALGRWSEPGFFVFQKRRMGYQWWCLVITKLKKKKTR